MKIKIFQNNLGYNSPDIEFEVNEWLNDNNIEVKELKQSYTTDGELIYTFLYYDKNELRKEKLNKIGDS